MNAAGPAYTPVFEGDHLRAALSVGGATGARDLLVVTFDFRRIGRKGFSEANFSSAFARQGHSQLSITCRENDWFINADTEALEQAIARVAAGFRRVQALGFSMGGYGAFRFARALNLRGVVAVSPQASIAPGVVPGDRRYAEEALRFDPALGDLTVRGKDDLRGVILVDPFIRHDIHHARLITGAFPRVRILPLPFAGHPASRVVGEARRIWLLHREAAAHVQTGAAIRAAHRSARRDSAIYWANLARSAEAHHPALARAALEQERICREKAEAARAAMRAEQEENTRRNALRRAALRTRPPSAGDGEAG
ncbi:MAG: alpha/beta hydrolase [Rubellimicrobium sp.]|nr:alpha/beta hydrolase [Rubellimicrobium sp.]